MHTEIAAVATKARLQKSLVFTSLAHHINSTKLWDMLQKNNTIDQCRDRWAISETSQRRLCNMVRSNAKSHA
jgi:hypothetical protein